MNVTLPQQDSPENQAKRQAWLNRSRQQYEYDPTYLPPLTVCKAVPSQESFSPRYLAERVPNTVAELSANALAVRVRSLWDPLDQLQDFEDFYPTLKPPSVMGAYQTDESFAEQRLSGANPMVIRRLTAWPEGLDVSMEAVEQALGGAVSLAGLLAQGHLLGADYRSLGFVKGGTYGKGKKYLPTPIALFGWHPMGYGTRGGLMPLAIQLQPGAIVTPFSPPNQWLYAKICVQIADANHHEMASHLAHTHFVMEPFAVATARQLAPTHPISLLFKPHFRFMLFNNELARRQLVNQGGIVDTLLAGTLAESLEIVRQSYGDNALTQWSFLDSALPKEMARRGLDQNSQTDLPHFPYRDDGLLLWQAIADYVAQYVALYYPSVTEVQEDYELQNWAQELADTGPEGGHIPGMPARIDTPAQLQEILTIVIYTCGPQHSAVNFTQYDYMGFIPNAPLAAYRPLPPQFSADQDLTLAELMAFLPPAQQVMGQIQILYTLSDYRYDQLGYYDQPFPDRRANQVLAQFRYALNQIEHRIQQRNKNRVVPYTVLQPSRVLNSISI